MRLRIAVCGGLLLAACAAQGIRAGQNHDDEELLQALARLEQQASYVKSAVAEYTVSYLPTTHEERRRLEMHFRLRGQDDRAQMAIRLDNRRDYHSTWSRKGKKEREEQNLVARPAMTTTVLYDGELVWELENSPFRSQLIIEPPTFQWNNAHRHQPMAFIQEFRTLSHGEIIRRSTDRKLTRVTTADGQQTELLVRHPTEQTLWLKLIFDEKNRLVARETLTTRPIDALVPENSRPTLYSRHDFYDLQPYDDGDGHTIWCPTQVLLRYFVGALPDGSLVQSHAIQVDIEKIDFNAEVSDEKFILQYPRNIYVDDRRDDVLSANRLGY